MDYVALLHTAQQRNSKYDIIYYTEKIKEVEEEKARVLKANIKKYLAKKAEEKKLEESKQSAPLRIQSPPLKQLQCERTGLPKKPQPVIRKTDYSSDILKQRKCKDEDWIKRQERFENFREKLRKSMPVEGEEMVPMTHHYPLKDVTPMQSAPTHQNPKENRRPEQNSFPSAMQQPKQRGNKRKQPVICSEKFSDGRDKSHFSEVDPFSYATHGWVRDYSNYDGDDIFGSDKKQSLKIIHNRMMATSLQQPRGDTVTIENETLEDLGDSQLDELARKMQSLIL